MVLQRLRGLQGISGFHELLSSETVDVHFCRALVTSQISSFSFFGIDGWLWFFHLDVVAEKCPAFVKVLSGSRHFEVIHLDAEHELELHVEEA